MWILVLMIVMEHVIENFCSFGFLPFLSIFHMHSFLCLCYLCLNVCIYISRTGWAALQQQQRLLFILMSFLGFLSIRNAFTSIPQFFLCLQRFTSIILTRSSAYFDVCLQCTATSRSNIFTPLTAQYSLNLQCSLASVIYPQHLAEVSVNSTLFQLQRYIYIFAVPICNALPPLRPDLNSLHPFNDPFVKLNASLIFFESSAEFSVCNCKVISISVQLHIYVQ